MQSAARWGADPRHLLLLEGHVTMEDLIPKLNKVQDLFNRMARAPVELPKIVVVGSQVSARRARCCLLACACSACSACSVDATPDALRCSWGTSSQQK